VARRSSSFFKEPCRLLAVFRQGAGGRLPHPEILLVLAMSMRSGQLT